MWCSNETHITEVRPLGEHDWRLRDNLKPVPEFTWQQRLIHRVEDCAESTAKSLLRATKKAVQNWWHNYSPAIGVRFAGIGLTALIIVTNVSEKLGG